MPFLIVHDRDCKHAPMPCMLSTWKALLANEACTLNLSLIHGQLTIYVWLNERKHRTGTLSGAALASAGEVSD